MFPASVPVVIGWLCRGVMTVKARGVVKSLYAHQYPGASQWRESHVKSEDKRAETRRTDCLIFQYREPLGQSAGGRSP